MARPSVLDAVEITSIRNKAGAHCCESEISSSSSKTMDELVLICPHSHGSSSEVITPDNQSREFIFGQETKQTKLTLYLNLTE